ncbi:type II toxin-antitoxin system PemK/MazF family toxin [Gellertiella hungarica]|uniref:mRNA interferase ChpB n=1 Tax=Gellertiella hungarica TaxID=1572859 RepID=A0A7W6J4F1_9HYPH|nr:type II toxin-antitoxin system PemK/MazF family toxin [Gellertiella hungarica]MBB4064573.1 mRNA interferase ChpB [Gellertiella hungarica]
MVRNPVPQRGDVYLVDLNPVVGNELRDPHRCVIITPREINALGLCLVAPVTTGGLHARRVGLAVAVTGHDTTGMILCNQLRTLDILARVQQKRARYIETIDSLIMDEVVARVASMIDPR